jgi:hypothetical protein
MVTTNVVELKTSNNLENLSIKIKTENLRHLGMCGGIKEFRI